MKLDAPKNLNYAAQVIRMPRPVDLNGLDNLVGVPVLGHQALTQRGKEAGELVIALTAETQLSHEYAHHNNLYRHGNLNADQTETGYLEDNRRVKAIRLRGHVSNALLMPLDSIAWTGVNPSELKEGDVFDVLNGQEVCRKYERKRNVPQNPTKNAVKKAFKRVDKLIFPEHLDTANYHRFKHMLYTDREVIVTQKLHGTSIRVGRVPCLREKKFRERVANKFGIQTPDYEFDVIYGSRKVIKDTNNAASGWYDSDIWTHYGQGIADSIPEGVIVYGELVGFTPDGSEIQKRYTYEAKPGEAQLYVYRVATVNRTGNLFDLPWDGVKTFCRERGLTWVPELDRVGPGANMHEVIENELLTRLDERFADFGGWHEPPVVVSDHRTVDEGFCFRQEGLVPLITKAKSAKFLEHETKMLDAEVDDIESAA